MLDEKLMYKFLRYYWKDVVSFAIDLAELDDKEKEAIELCGRRRLTIEQAAESASPPVSVNTMQNRWSKAKWRLRFVWGGLDWVRVLAETVE